MRLGLFSPATFGGLLGLCVPLGLNVSRGFLGRLTVGVDLSALCSRALSSFCGLGLMGLSGGLLPSLSARVGGLGLPCCGLLVVNLSLLDKSFARLRRAGLGGLAAYVGLSRLLSAPPCNALSGVVRFERVIGVYTGPRWRPGLIAGLEGCARGGCSLLMLLNHLLMLDARGIADS